jgi:hypothetical protein
MDWNFDLLPGIELEKLDKQNKVWIVYKQHLQQSYGSIRCLAIYRLLIALATSSYCVALAVLRGPLHFFGDLTNWAMTSMGITFWMMCFDHLSNGHYREDKCQQRFKKRCRLLCCDGYWKWVTLLYEIQAVLIFTMGFFFWTTQVPYMIWGPKWAPPIDSGAPKLDT